MGGDGGDAERWGARGEPGMMGGDRGQWGAMGGD